MKCELLAPAKDLHKAKTAIRYGADAVYIGGKDYSLRSRASNFTEEDMQEAVRFAHEHGARLYVTINIVFHDEDLYGVREYLQRLESYGVDAVIIESLGLLQIGKKAAPKLEYHISTQLSSLNSASVAMLEEGREGGGGERGGWRSRRGEPATYRTGKGTEGGVGGGGGRGIES